jgi:hypothetical protein
MKLRCPQRDEICELVDSPAMAVDLEFGASKSCGLAWQLPDDEIGTETVSFGQCVKHVAGFLTENPNSALVVEAPLSGLFDSADNPKGRMPFEKVSVDDKIKTRYWFVQSGAAVGLGAVFLFTRLSEIVRPESGVTASVIEGFVSFKTHSSNHAKDAHALLCGLRNPDTAKIYDIEASVGERSVNMLRLAGLASQEDPCPAVMVVKVDDLISRL